MCISISGVAPPTPPYISLHFCAARTRWARPTDTGKTIAQRSQVQVSFSLVDASAGSYDLYYKTAYQGTNQ